RVSPMSRRGFAKNTAGGAGTTAFRSKFSTDIGKRPSVGVNARSPSIPPLARTPAEWTEALRPLGARTFHARQLFRWLHGRGVLEPERMTDLPKSLRTELAALELDRPLVVADERCAADGTRKLLVRFRDSASVETVLIPGVSGGKQELPSPVAALERAAACAAGVDDDDEEVEDAIGAEPRPPAHVRVTQCVSTQVGCAMGCAF